MAIAAMMFFIAMMSFVTAGLMLAIFTQEIWDNGLRLEAEDRIVDVFLCTGFICMLVSSGYQMWTLLG
jgi:p-aminobenzoyl-glutamate transporter AbgT